MHKRLIIFVLTLIFSQTLVVQACMPAGPDPWYTQQIEINETTLPEGITLSKTIVGKFGNILISRESDAIYKTYKLTNATTENIFVLKQNTENRVRSLEEALIPQKYVINYVLPPNDSVTIDEKVYVSPTKFEEVYKDDRPSDAKAPNSQNIIIPIQYKGQTVEIQGKAVYGLNTSYNPTLGANGAKGCAEWNRTSYMVAVIPYLICTLVFLLIMGWLIKKIRKAVVRNSKHENK